jgi:RHS repeat-associated protein
VPSAGTTATPYPGSLQGISYTPTGLVSQVKQSSGTTTQTITYLYDAGGSLLVQEDPTSVTYYADGGAEQISYTTAGVVSSATRFYGESPDGTTVVRAVTGITSSGSTSAVCYEVSDPQHTGAEVINAATLAVIRRYYDPYGNQLATTATTSNPWPDNRAFLGKVQDAPTQLDLLGARQYNPATGAFLSLDPVLESGSPQQMGGYTYAGNNPVTSADPSGLQGDGSTPPICNTAPTAAPNICGNANPSLGGSGGSGDTPDRRPTGPVPRARRRGLPRRPPRWRSPRQPPTCPRCRSPASGSTAPIHTPSSRPSAGIPTPSAASRTRSSGRASARRST